MSRLVVVLARGPGPARFLLGTDPFDRAEHGDGTEAVAPARRYHPDVVLMDVRMPVQDGIEATRLTKGDDETSGGKEDRILIEVCLTSNLRLGLVPDVHSHPLPAFVAAGVPVSFNTDLPVRWRIDLGAEERLAGEVLGCAREEILQLQARAMAFAFRPRPIAAASKLQAEPTAPELPPAESAKEIVNP